ncbi:hypothetical protein [Nocardia higoensis]|uniref:hypothetical protein n=1 Tax=Nocardia higoensis TaxID=228599 RepID=UPI0003033D55|nr:hypothetical protein [Nocardia higoensis]
MSEQTTVAHSPASAAPDSGTAPARPGILLAWSLAASAAVTVPVGGGQMVLMAKPIAGTIGVPGEVIGYIALTAALLGCLTALAVPRLLRLTSARAGAWAALGAGAALVLTGVADGPILFSVGALLAGALIGITYTTCRIRFAGLGGGARTARHALTWLGLLAAAMLSRSFYPDPMTGLLIAGVVATGFGILAVPISAGPWQEPVTAPVAGPDRWALFGYGAAGFATGAAVTSAMYVLSHRWEVLGADQMPLIGAAAAAALIVVVLPLRPASIPLLLVVAAGGLLLVAIAPGSASTAAGLAVTVAAAARTVTDLDRSTAATGTTRSSARAVCVGGLGAVAGFATAEVLREVTAAGTAITLTVFPVLALTAAWTILAARPATSSEGDHS